MRPYNQDFGVSWGLPGFRIGKSQYGTWWVSVRLPLGFRITKRLGRQRDPAGSLLPPNSISTTPLPAPFVPVALPAQQAKQVQTSNQKILEQMRHRKP
jgi:hypothetical protein